MHRNLTFAALGAAALALLSVAGCSASATSGGAAPATQPTSSSGSASSAVSSPAPAPSFTGTSSVDACKLLTKAEISKVVGEALKPSLPGDKSSCATTDSSTTGTFVSVSISVHSPASAQSMNLVRPGDAVNVTGLGNEAYCSKILLAVLSGSDMVQVSAPDCAQAEALARIALPRL
jgi:hypothetical protein